MYHFIYVCLDIKKAKPIIIAIDKKVKGNNMGANILP